VIVIANVDVPDTLDQILLDLPIMKLNGQHGSGRSDSPAPV